MSARHEYTLEQTITWVDRRCKFEFTKGITCHAVLIKNTTKSIIDWESVGMMTVCPSCMCYIDPVECSKQMTILTHSSKIPHIINRGIIGAHWIIELEPHENLCRKTFVNCNMDDIITHSYFDGQQWIRNDSTMHTNEWSQQVKEIINKIRQMCEEFDINTLNFEFDHEKKSCYKSLLQEKPLVDENEDIDY